MSLRDKIEHAIQNQPCMVKDLKAKFGGDRAADRKVMEALDELVHDAVVCQKSGVFFTARSGRAEKALPCKVVKLGKNFAFVMLEDEPYTGLYTSAQARRLANTQARIATTKNTMPAMRVTLASI